MTKQELLEGNKLIAEFMGYKIERHLNIDHFIPPQDSYEFEIASVFFVDELNFDGSYDWLMPVIEVISKIKVPNARGNNDTYYPLTFGMPREEDNLPMFRFKYNPLFTEELLITAAYKAVVCFLSNYTK